jgi:hypothetical protein
MWKTIWPQFQPFPVTPPDLSPPHSYPSAILLTNIHIFSFLQILPFLPIISEKFIFLQGKNNPNYKVNQRNYNHIKSMFSSITSMGVIIS